MRCPKCGYNSFDHLDSCKKCGKSLVEFKQSFGIKSVLFPGHMSPGGVAEEAEFDSVAADAAVSVATGATVAAAASTVIDEPAVDGTDSDDFGFDFMGDSAEDDDLSFDELFEEAPEDEDIEETIEAPKETAVAAEAESGDDFSFDLPDEAAELEDDFGFDPVDEANDSSTEDDFSFDDEPESTSDSEDSGTEEGPKRPFDLPESPLVVGTPVANSSPLGESPVVSAADGETGEMFIADGGSLLSEDSAESDVLNTDEDVLSSPTSDEQSDLVATEVESVIATSAPLTTIAGSAANTVSTVVTETPCENVADGNMSLRPSLGNCIGAFIFDLVLLVIVGIGFIVAAEAAMSTGETRWLPSLETLIDLSIPYFLVLFFLAFGYFTLFHFLVGQTPGKMLTGLRVETIDGEPLAFSQAFLRSVGGLLQLLPAGLGYLVTLANPDRRGWNDRLAGTRVVVLRNPSGKFS